MDQQKPEMYKTNERKRVIFKLKVLFFVICKSTQISLHQDTRKHDKITANRGTVPYTEDENVQGISITSPLLKIQHQKCCSRRIETLRNRQQPLPFFSTLTKGMCPCTHSKVI